MTPRALRILLVLSLGVNLLIVGLVAGALVSGAFRDGRPRAVDLSVGPLSEALDEADRRAIRAALGEVVRRNRDERMGRNAALDDLVAALRAEPFDRTAVQAVLEAEGAGLAAVQRAAQQVYLDRLEAMGPAARAAYADRLGERARHLRRDRDDDRP